MTHARLITALRSGKATRSELLDAADALEATLAPALDAELDALREQGREIRADLERRAAAPASPAADSPLVAAVLALLDERCVHTHGGPRAQYWAEHRAAVAR